MKRLRLTLLAVVATIAVHAHAGPFEDGEAAYERGDYATALRLWHPLAEEDHAQAQSNLGVMYHYGDGVAQDFAEALKWYRLAAEQGHREAQYYLGIMYDEGNGVPQDDAEAVRWWSEAADQGLPQAQTNLGVMYGNGEGVQKDLLKAYMWFSIAIAQGAEKAQHNRDIAARRLSSAQIMEAERLAREWLTSHKN